MNIGVSPAHHTAVYPLVDNAAATCVVFVPIDTQHTQWRCLTFLSLWLSTTTAVCDTFFFFISILRRMGQNRRNPICRTGLQRILAGRAADWPPAVFYCPRFFLANAWRSRARALLASRTGQSVRGRVGVGVRVRGRVRVGVAWGLCRYLGQKCAKTSCKNSLQARPANGGSRQ